MWDGEVGVANLMELRRICIDDLVVLRECLKDVYKAGVGGNTMAAETK